MSRDNVESYGKLAGDQQWGRGDGVEHLLSIWQSAAFLRSHGETESFGGGVGSDADRWCHGQRVIRLKFQGVNSSGRRHYPPIDSTSGEEYNITFNSNQQSTADTFPG